MQNLLSKIIKRLKWLFKWTKYLIIILIGFIYFLFHQEKSVKLEHKKEKLKDKMKNSAKPYHSSLPSDEENFLIKDTLFKMTDREIKEEIKYFYCKEKEKRIYELTKKDNERIEKLTEVILPMIVIEINEKYISSQEQLKENIVKLGKEKLIQIEEEENSIELTVSKVPKRKKEEKIAKTKIPEQNNLKEPKIILNLNKLNENIQNNNSEIPFVNQNSFIPSPLINETKENFIAATPKQNIPSDVIPIIPLKVERKKDNQVNMSPLKPVDKNNVQINAKIIREKESLSKKEDKLKQIEETIPKEEYELKQVEEILPKKENESAIAKEAKDTQDLQKEALEKEKIEESKLVTTNTMIIDTQISKLKESKREEQRKTDFEDKGYDTILLKIDLLLKELENIQTKPLKPKDQAKVNQQILELQQQKREIEKNKESELANEENLLKETITEQELFTLEEKLKKLNLEHLIDLNEKLLTKVEDLDNLSKEQAAKIEKELIKLNLKKACHTLELPSLILLPSIRNRYFFSFTAALFISNHLNFLTSILRHKTIIVEESKLKYIKKGSEALEEALKLTTNNISYLAFLEQDILFKYPELSLDKEYLIYINKLKYSLMMNQEKLLKKKKMIEKYNLKYQVKVRKLKKKKIA